MDHARRGILDRPRWRWSCDGAAGRRQRLFWPHDSEPRDREAVRHDPEKWVPVFPRDKREAFARRSCSNKMDRYRRADDFRIGRASRVHDTHAERYLARDATWPALRLIS